MARRRKRTRRRPFIGPCHDPLGLWFLEYERQAGPDGPAGVYRRYYADRPEAMAALAVERGKLTEPQQRMIDVIRKHADADGWASWDYVFPDWDVHQNVPPQFAGRSARLVWQALLKRGLVEDDGGRVKVVADAK